MKKKLVALILTAVMLGSMLTGCGSGQPDSGAAAAEDTAEDSSDAEAAEATEKNTEGTAEEAAGEIPVITIWSSWAEMTDLYPDQGDVPFWLAVEEATGVDLQFIDSTGGAESLSILIGTNDLPDIVIDRSDNLPGGIHQQLQQGNIIALNEAMDAGYMPNLKAYMEANEEVDKLSKNDEGLYPWAPMIRGEDSYLVFAGNLIRQDWLDELGLEEPKTLQELEDILVAFKEQKGCDTGYAPAWGSYDLMVNTFGIDEEMYVGADGKVHFGPVEDGYLDFLTLFNRWYGMGILDPDAFTQGIDSFYAKMASDRTGVVYGYTGSTLNQVEAMKAEHPEMDYQPISHPVLNEGDAFPYDRSEYRVAGSIGAMISDNCENVEAAARVIDYLYSDEGYILTNFGVEGITYEVTDGEYSFTDFVNNNPDGLSSTIALSIYAGNANKAFIVDGTAQKLGYSLDVQKKSLDVWAAEGDAKELPLLSLTPEESEEYTAIYNEVKTYVDEFKLKFIFGTEPLENFPKFVENIRNMNIDRAIEIQQAAYDRYLAR